MGPNELLAAVPPAPVGADEYGVAIRTLLYVEADRYLYVHYVIDNLDGVNERKNPLKY